ncbi:MAG: hypothetical protein VZR54_09745 [Ruminococcus sp.]|nr:hypothetical protein [Ruminococcus sp.]
MAANNLTFEQASAFLTDLYEQASGSKAIAVTDTASFVTVAQATLKTGYDNVINSISQVLGRTIFSVRPYNAKFAGLQVDAQRYGDITRKINFVDGDVENDERLPLTDGGSVDMYKINKPKILQTNFYGGATYQRHITIFKDQLDTAFQSYEEFSRFISGVMQNVMDQLEQIKEAESRAALVNFIGGKNAGDTANVINVITQYNGDTGSSVTAADLFNETNFVPFSKWLYAFINGLMRKMSDRSTKYHINITGKELHRHTPANRMKAYMSARFLDNIDSVTLPTIFGADRLKMIDWEAVSYWQNINDPEHIIATPSYLAADGSITVAKKQDISGIVGVLFDEEAVGVTRINEWSERTPFNAAGGYSNIYWHFTQRYWNDFTENGVVLIAQ